VVFLIPKNFVFLRFKLTATTPSLKWMSVQESLRYYKVFLLILSQKSYIFINPMFFYEKAFSGITVSDVRIKIAYLKSQSTMTRIVSKLDIICSSHLVIQNLIRHLRSLDK